MKLTKSNLALYLPELNSLQVAAVREFAKAEAREPLESLIMTINNAGAKGNPLSAYLGVDDDRDSDDPKDWSRLNRDQIVKLLKGELDKLQ